MADPCHRLALCQAVALSDPLFTVEALELERQGPSYTIDTVHELRRKGWTKVSWLIGADMVQTLPTWHRAEELQREVEFVIAQRPGYAIDWGALPPLFRALEAQVVPAPMLEVSASDIRRRVAGGRSIRYLVPPEVETYIAEHPLYLNASTGADAAKGIP